MGRRGFRRLSREGTAELEDRLQEGTEVRRRRRPVEGGAQPPPNALRLGRGSVPATARAP